MNLLQLRKKSFATLLAFVLAVMLAGCAGTSGGDDCGCDDGDIDCKERCAQDKLP